MLFRSAWALSVLAPGGTCIVPQPKEDTGLLANRTLALWPYADMTDERVRWDSDYITLKQDAGMEQAFKFGINNTYGAAAYLNGGIAFIKRYEPQADAVYPDFGVSMEVYTDKRMLELETLSPLLEVQPGDVIEHTEQWELKQVSVFDSYAAILA